MITRPLDFRRVLKNGFIGASGRSGSAFATPPIPFWNSFSPGMTDAGAVAAITPLILTVALPRPERLAVSFSLISVDLGNLSLELVHNLLLLGRQFVILKHIESFLRLLVALVGDQHFHPLARALEECRLGFGLRGRIRCLRLLRTAGVAATDQQPGDRERWD